MGEVKEVTCAEYYGWAALECGNPFDDINDGDPNAGKYGYKTVRGKFRCDSFVVFAYKQGAGVDIMSKRRGRNGRNTDEPSTDYTPKVIYNKMPKQR